MSKEAMAQPVSWKPEDYYQDGWRDALQSVQKAQQKQPAPVQPGRNHYEDGDVFERIAASKKQPPVQQEPVAIVAVDGVGHIQVGWITKPQHNDKLYTSPPAQRKPLTDEEFLELILRTGTQELVGLTTFVGGSIQMQGMVGLLRSAKVIKEFVEAAHGIKE